MSVTLVLADLDTAEAVDKLLRLFGVGLYTYMCLILFVSCLCFGPRVARFHFQWHHLRVRWSGGEGGPGRITTCNLKARR